MCGWPTQPAIGRILELVANGRTICPPCGRFQVHCTCDRPMMVPADIDLELVS